MGSGGQGAFLSEISSTAASLPGSLWLRLRHIRCCFWRGGILKLFLKAIFNRWFYLKFKFQILHKFETLRSSVNKRRTLSFPSCSYPGSTPCKLDVTAESLNQLVSRLTCPSLKEEKRRKRVRIGPLLHIQGFLPAFPVSFSIPRPMVDRALLIFYVCT